MSRYRLRHRIAPCASADRSNRQIVSTAATRGTVFWLPLARLVAATSAVILLMTGCASAPAPVPTSYGPATDSVVYGYSETQIADDSFQVAFRGNRPTSLERATDFALLRAATVALANGCRHFAIAAMDVVSTDEEPQAPRDSAPQTVEEANPDLPAGRNPTRPAGDVASPTAVVTISCVQDSRDEVSSYDAQFVRDNVAAKYDLPEGTGRSDE